MNKQVSWNIHLTLLLVAGVALMLRLYRVSAPLADWHSWRQSDTAAVARNFEKRGIDILRPRYDDLSNIQSGKDNPQGWRMVEMPLYQVAGVWVHQLLPSLSLEASLRVVSAVSSALSVYLLGVLLAMTVGGRVAILGSFFYAVLPYAIYFGRTILPDSFALFFALLSLVLLAKDEGKLRNWYMVLGSACAAAISILVRPMAGFLLLPSAYFLFRGRNLSIGSLIAGVLFAFVSLFPFIWWRSWILAFPEGIPANDWLLNNNGIRFKGAWFYWLFAKRLGELILGYWGLILLGFGIAAKSREKEGMISFLWALGATLYVIVFAGGNVQHDYYQVVIIPVVSWFLAKGADALLSGRHEFHRGAAWALLGVTTLFSLAFSWYTIRTYYWINRPEIIEAGKAADTLLPAEAKVIAPYNGDTTFLYQTNRQGWPLGFDIPQKIAMGATHYVTVSPTDEDGETRALASEYTVIVRNDKFAIIDLTKPNPLKQKR